MIRKPTYAGNVEEKAMLDFEYWAFQKTAVERLQEAWRLHCLNHNISVDTRLNKKVMVAKKRNSG